MPPALACRLQPQRCCGGPIRRRDVATAAIAEANMHRVAPASASHTPRLAIAEHADPDWRKDLWVLAIDGALCFAAAFAVLCLTRRDKQR